jgi:hypothetical protein
MRVILHIGLGKTGTSALQHMMRVSRDEFIEQAIYPVDQSFGDCWDTASYIEAGKLVNCTDNFKSVFKELISSAVNRANENSCNTVFYSNESWSNLKIPFYTFINEAVDELGLDLVYYVTVREFSDWVVSCYKQWGLYHKVYKGGVQSFTSWLNEEEISNILRFPERLKLIEELSSETVVFEYSSTVNFEIINHLGFSYSGSNVKVNDRNNLPLSILYNNNFQEPKSPHEIEDFIQKYSSSTFLSKLELNQGVALSNIPDDIKSMWVDLGFFASDDFDKKLDLEYETSNNNLMSYFLFVLVKQSGELENLRREIEQLKRN